MVHTTTGTVGERLSAGSSVDDDDDNRILRLSIVFVFLTERDRLSNVEFRILETIPHVHWKEVFIELTRTCW